MIKLYDFPMSPRARKVSDRPWQKKDYSTKKSMLTSPKVNKKNPNIWQSTHTAKSRTS